MTLISTHTSTEQKVEAAKVEFYAVPNYNMETVLGDFSTRVGNEYSYILHVEGTSFKTKQMIMKTNDKSCIEKRFSQQNM